MEIHKAPCPEDDTSKWFNANDVIVLITDEDNKLVSLRFEEYHKRCDIENNHELQILVTVKLDDEFILGIVSGKVSVDENNEYIITIETELINNKSFPIQNEPKVGLGF